jgi:tetratricopeptide (TPR) repeat protein
MVRYNSSSPARPGTGRLGRRPAAVNKITVALLAFMVLVLYAGSVGIFWVKWYEAEDKATQLEGEKKQAKDKADEEGLRVSEREVEVSELKRKLEEAEKKLQSAQETTDTTPMRPQGPAPLPELGQGDLLDNAIEVYRRALVSQGDNPVTAREAARLYMWDAGFYYRERKFGEAEELCKKAIGILKKLRAEVSDLPELRQELARAYLEQGNILVALGDPKRLGEARGAWNEALALQDRLVKDYPSVPTYRQQLAEMSSNIGLFLVDNKQKQEYQERARKELEQLTREFPKIHEYRSQLGSVLANLAFQQSAAGLYKEADKNIDEAIKQQRAAWEASRSNLGYRYLVFQHYLLKADMQRMHRKSHELVAATLNELINQNPDTWNIYYQIAVYYAHCLRMAEEDTKLTKAKKLELATYYGNRGLAVLRLTIDKGTQQAGGQLKADHPLLDRLANDKDLDPLRARSGFKDLLAPLGLKA